MTNAKRKIEIFSAGCPVCEDAVRTINDVACPSCKIEVLDMNSAAGRKRAAELGVRAVPAVVIDGKVADCCAGGGIDLDTLRAGGLGQR